MCSQVSFKDTSEVGFIMRKAYFSGTSHSMYKNLSPTKFEKTQLLRTEHNYRKPSPFKKSYNIIMFRSKYITVPGWTIIIFLTYKILQKTPTDQLHINQYK